MNDLTEAQQLERTRRIFAALDAMIESLAKEMDVSHPSLCYLIQQLCTQSLHKWNADATAEILKAGEQYIRGRVDDEQMKKMAFEHLAAIHAGYESQKATKQ